MSKKFSPKTNPKIKVKKLQETEGMNTGFGNYHEDTGGGHPFEAGNSNTRTTKENGKMRQAENPKTNQPRTSDGKFTYKSVNGKSIDPKYGPSRGVTVPPTLTNGENGVYIKESYYTHDVYNNDGKKIHKKGELIEKSTHNVEEDFGKKSGSYWDKYKNKWYKEGGEVVTTGLSTKIASKAVWEQEKEYSEELGEYEGESSHWKSKSGKKSKEEEAASELVKEKGEQQFVLNKETGAIKVKGEGKGKGKEFKKFVEEKKEEKEKETPTVEEPPKTEDKPFGTSGKLTQRHVDNFKKQLKEDLENQVDEADLTDENIEAFLLSLKPEELEELYNYQG